jgi:hypothetical protein
MNDEKMNSDELKLNLRQNALDSLEHALHHFGGSKAADYKYVVLHFAHAIELFLKARLEVENYTLIYVRPEEAKKKDAKTIDLKTAISRLSVNSVTLDEQEIKDLHFIKDVRNSIEHHVVELKKSEVQVYVGRAFRFLNKFLEDELEINLLDEFPKEMFKNAIENLVSYEDRLEIAKNEMNKYRSDPKDGGDDETVFCEECGEETILYPDPTAKDNHAHCFNCEAIFEMERCGRCGLPFIVGNEDESLCDECFADLVSEVE